ncbi:MAG: murein L,D-transpeptidase [Chloroflexi bacterium]|nr:MAG: murein L,D-transpeptidase [Chloroflexota bacterium]
MCYSQAKIRTAARAGCGLLLALISAAPARAAAPLAPPPPAVDPAYLCTPFDQRQGLAGCPNAGPGATAARLQSFQLPWDLPLLPAAFPEKSDLPVNRSYARAAPDTPVFNQPQPPAGSLPVRQLGIGQNVGFLYVSLTTNPGLTWTQINEREYVRTDALVPVGPSDFQGAKVTTQPQRALAWLVQTVRPFTKPAWSAPQQKRALERYTLVQVYATLESGSDTWLLVGPHAWVEHRAVGLVQLTAPPPGVSGRWIDVNLYEQTLAAYEDERMVYTTLVSSGISQWVTHPGLFQIYEKLLKDDMGGAFAADQSDYYLIEDVPWVMYYDGSRALHGAYWHNKFGFQKSHGCVNLSPRDALWLYEWADTETWVWVHDPSGRTPTKF